MVIEAVARRLRYSQVHRKFHSTPPYGQAVPALRRPPTASKGWFSWLFKDPLPALPALCDPLPNVELPPPLDDHIEASATKITTLSNGLRVASEQVPGPTTTIGIYVEAGSVNEDPSCAGITHLLERMAFKATKNRTHFRLIREVEAIGANIMASATREQMAYTGDTIKTYVPQMVEILVDSLRNPVFYKWEVEEQKAKIKAELAEMSNNPQSLLLEALHTAAYEGALGKPLLASESSLLRLDGPALSDFVSRNYTAPRVVLAACGVEHDELLQIAEPLISDWPAEPNEPAPTSKYVGGDWRGTADSPTTHVALAFEVKGGWRNEANAFAVTVLQTLLGGGGSFSSGGPGKGMYSRLYTRVLNQYDRVQSFTAFNSIYNDSGLFGIHATSDSEFVPKLVDVATLELMSVIDDVSEEEVQRAKSATISAVLMNLEARVVVTEDIGRQILTYGQRKPIQDFIKSVDALTVKDIKEAAKKLMSTPLAMASWGDVVHVPRYDQIACRFR